MVTNRIGQANLLAPQLMGGLQFGEKAAATVYNGLVTPSDFTVTYDATTMVFTVVVGAATVVNVAGKQFTIAAATYVLDPHADTSGVFYVIVDDSGVLEVASTFSFLTNAIVGYAYHNKNTSKGVAFNEKHPAIAGFPPLVHQYDHTHTGAVLVSGGTVSGITVDNPSDASMQLDVDETVFDDESLRITNAALVGGAGQYTVWYRSGAVADNEWNWTTDLDIPIMRANDNPLWNDISGANAANTEASANSRWVNYWFIATNSSEAKHKYISIMGQTLHTSIAAAQAENFLTGISWGTLPFKEMLPLAKLTVRRAAAGSGNDFYIDEYQLLRGTQVSLTSIVSPSIHNNLSGRSEAGAHPASALTYDPTTSLLTAETVQAAIDELVANPPPSGGGGPLQTLVDAATIVWDSDDGFNAKVTITENRVLGDIDNAVEGATYILKVIQDGTGGSLMTFDTGYKFPGGTAPALTGTANAVDILFFFADTTTTFRLVNFIADSK